MSERASEYCALLGTIDPIGAAAGALVSSDAVDVSLYDSILFLAIMGTVCSSGNVFTMSIYEGTVSGTVTTAIDTVTRTTSTADDNFQLMFDLDTSHLSSPAHKWVKMTLGHATGKSWESAGVILGFKPRYHPASDNDLDSLYTITQST
jgi:hypothetical protein